jgi:hypothetical protein
VTLLSITKAVSFVHPKNAPPGAQPVEAVPMFQVTYLVEHLGTDPIEHGNTGPHVLRAGTDELFSQRPKQSEYKATDLDEYRYDGIIQLPKAADQSRTDVRRYTLRGIPAPVSTFDLIVREGFNDRVFEFHFPDVPLPS